MLFFASWWEKGLWYGTYTCTCTAYSMPPSPTSMILVKCTLTTLCVCHSVSMYSAVTSNSHIFQVHCEMKCPFLALTYSVQTRSLYIYIVYVTILLYCSSHTIYSQPINKALHVCTNVLASSYCSKYGTDFILCIHVGYFFVVYVTSLVLS